MTVSAPSADPVPLPDKLADVAQSIQEAGSGSQSSAASVATPGQETQINPDDYNESSAVSGNTIDTSKLEVGSGDQKEVTLDNENSMGEAGGKVVFENPAE